MLAVAGSIPLWEQHWQRLQWGARCTGISLPPRPDLERAWQETLAAAESQAGDGDHRAGPIPDGPGPPAAKKPGLTPPRHGHRVRLTVTAGNGFDPPGSAALASGFGAGLPATVVVTAQACPAWTPWTQQTGQTLVTYPHPFEPPLALRGCKSTSYLPWLLAGQFAARAGRDDAVLLNGRGQVIETSRRNVFVWHGDRLWTPDLGSGCLPGVMRQQVIRIAEKSGLTVTQEPLPARLLTSAQAVLVTSAVTGMQWVRCLDDRDWEPGPAKALEAIDQALRSAVWGV
jgi:branched-subunit amino acid aminotransferase/4-amino-4-deoxychorismate lyase